ncbi:MAG: ABC-2 family transporter protein [Calditrichaeota bacterium]|nr:ABC-2 family transporter protein [Calditrichota bacterium]
MRYLRLYLYFLRFSFSRAMEFRLDFWFRIVMDCTFYAVQIIFFRVLYTQTGFLGGWSFEQSLVFICGFFLIDAIHMTVFANNLWWLPILINKGDLDYYLLRPISSLYFLSLRDFAANSFVNLIIATGLLAWALSSYPGTLGTVPVILFLLGVLNGSLLYYILHICFLIPVFWLHSNRGLGDIFFTLQSYAERPDRIFSGYVRRLLVTALPFSLIVSFPTRVLFEGLTLRLLLHISGVTLLAFLFLLWLWNRGMRAYSSASS